MTVYDMLQCMRPNILAYKRNERGTGAEQSAPKKLSSGVGPVHPVHQQLTCDTPGRTRYCDWLSNLDIYLAGEMFVVARSPILVLYSLKASEITHQ